jgi:adenylate cyclase
MPTYQLISFGGEQRFDLRPGRPLIVGRAVASDLPIFDPTISRRHAELVVEDEGVRVRDLGSSNGTFVNGAVSSEGWLGANDTVAFGKVAFYVRAVEIAAVPPSPRPLTAPGGTIVRQMAVQAGSPAQLDGPSAAGQLRVPDVDQGARQAHKLSLLLDISQKLSGELDLDRLLGTVVAMMFEVMQVDRVAILLRDPHSGDLMPRVTKSRIGGAEGLKVPQSIARKAVEERVAIQTDNAAADARFKGKSVVLQSVRSAMCSPMLASGDTVLGLLYVDNLRDTGSFTDEDLQFLAAFSGLAASGIRNAYYADQVRREALVRSNFERYFAPNVAAEIAQQEGAVRLGGQKRPLTVLFSDIRGFTAMAETMTPDAIAGLLSAYFTEMVDVIFEHGGTLDKFIGDAIMALWGAPIQHEDDPDRAMQAALGMQRVVAEINRRWTEQGRPTIAVGIGINYGEAFAGNIGSHRRLEYTVIGDAVNIASRLCAEAGPGEILLSEPFYHMLKAPPPVEPVEGIALRGRAGKVAVYKTKEERGTEQ